MSLARYYAECAEMRGVEPGHVCDRHHVRVEAGEGCEACETELEQHYELERTDCGDTLELAECFYCHDWAVPIDVADVSVCRDCLKRAERDNLPPLVDYARPLGCRS